MIRRQTGIVVLVFFAVLIVALVIARPEAAELDQTPTAAPEPVWSIESSDIVGITVESLREEQILTLEREEGVLWRMTQPQAMAVDAARVERAASWLAEPSPRAEIFDALDLSAFELDEPHYRITVQTAQGGSLELTVGREAPTGGSRYAQFNDRLGVLVFSTVGLDEVLQLGPELIPTPTPEPTPTLTETPDPTPQPGEAATEAPDSTPQPGEAPTETKEPTQEVEG